MPPTAGSDTQTLRDRTIRDFGDQWSRYEGNQGWYGSGELFRDIVEPLLGPDDLRGAGVVEIGSGTGRIVGMLLGAGVGTVTAVEPSADAFAVLERNVAAMPDGDRVVLQNVRGDAWSTETPPDLVVSIGVIHHIPDPIPVLDRAFAALRPGGRLMIWVYGHEGNRLYLSVVQPVRAVTTRLPHGMLRGVVEVFYRLLQAYRTIGRLLPLPQRSYIENVLWKFSPAKRRLVIYDQLNPAHARYYRRHEVEQLLADRGFVDVRLHHRHGYSWSAVATKPA
ncbi:MAG: class I SAM-dependent methyltransferase [Acidobacteriota bacterium]